MPNKDVIKGLIKQGEGRVQEVVGDVICNLDLWLRVSLTRGQAKSRKRLVVAGLPLDPPRRILDGAVDRAL